MVSDKYNAIALQNIQCAEENLEQIFKYDRIAGRKECPNCLLR